MPQLSGGGSSLSDRTSALVKVFEGGSGGSDSGTGHSSGRSTDGRRKYRAVVTITSDADRDRVFYDDGEVAADRWTGQEENTSRRGSSSTRSVGSEGNCSGDEVTVGRAVSGPGGMALGVPEAARWAGLDGELPKVVTHENGAIVNGYLLVNGTENLDIPLIENGQCDGKTQNHKKGVVKRYHVSGVVNNGTSNGKGANGVDESTFAGSRDVKNPHTLKDLKIVSAKGTIRGVKNRVRAGIATFLDNKKEVNYRAVEKGQIIVYTTSMRIIRETYERCQKTKMILQTHMVVYEEKDVFMSRENQRDLMERLNMDTVIVPQVFADGQHLGGVHELDYMNESGELRQIFQSFKKVQHVTSCKNCGGYRFVNCLACHGSKKSLNRNHFTEEFCALRCVACDENGLVRCSVCDMETIKRSQKGKK